MLLSLLIPISLISQKIDQINTFRDVLVKSQIKAFEESFRSWSFHKMFMKPHNETVQLTLCLCSWANNFNNFVNLLIRKLHN
jgi:hypothetical protein